MDSKPRSRRSIPQIHELLKQFAESKISVADFCKSNRIDKGTFYKWQSRYKHIVPLKTERPGFADVRIIPSSSPALFAEVGVIKIFQPVAASYLKELVQ